MKQLQVKRTFKIRPEYKLFGRKIDPRSLKVAKKSDKKLINVCMMISIFAFLCSLALKVTNSWLSLWDSKFLVELKNTFA